MAYDPHDTIAAIGTAAGGGLRGMVRISGPQMLACVQRVFEPEGEALTASGAPRVVPGTAPLAGQTLPCDLWLWPNQQSYTRQPTAELHTLGAPALLEQLLRALCAQGARLAEPGEFTLRAFLAGRLDLTQAEAVLGVIDAHSPGELSSALAQLAGGLSQPLSQLREQLLQLLAELEAGLDFVEEDIEFITAQQLRQQLTAAQQTVTQTVQQLASRSQAPPLPRVVLSGPPNAGKSSLFNAIVQHTAATQSTAPALVSEQAGTTRDFVTARIEYQGNPFELVDTAGLEEDNASEGTLGLDALAQGVSHQQRDQATLVLRCQAAEALAAKQTPRPHELLVWTKWDLVAAKLPAGELACSSLDDQCGHGIQALLTQITQQLADAAGDGPSLTASRCQDSLHRADSALAAALELVEQRGGEELIAAEVRAALDAIGQVVGAVYTDDVLDRIFGQFCIGK